MRPSQNLSKLTDQPPVSYRNILKANTPHRVYLSRICDRNGSLRRKLSSVFLWTVRTRLWADFMGREQEGGRNTRSTSVAEE